MYQNYIFDLYGTLVDIRTNETKEEFFERLALLYSLQGAFYHTKEFKEMYQEFMFKEENRACKCSSKAEAEILIDNVLKNLYQYKGIEADKRQIADMAVMMRTISMEYIKLFDGVIDVLEQLGKRGKSIFLLSNAQRLFTEPEMKMLGIYDMFDGILYSSDAGIKKPSPCFFDLLFKRYQLSKEESVMVGNDCIADIKGAREYGIDSMYIHTEQSSEITIEFPGNCRLLKTIAEVME